MSVDDYSAEFDYLMLKGKLVEPEKQMIARYIGGLRRDTSKVGKSKPTIPSKIVAKDKKVDGSGSGSKQQKKSSTPLSKG
ncbi:hypothetical protein DITRI_Ditri04bG0127600 [Diplodiscus trichospermus]